MVKNHVSQVDFILVGLLGNPWSTDFHGDADIIPGATHESKSDLTLCVSSYVHLTHRFTLDVYILCAHCE